MFKDFRLVDSALLHEVDNLVLDSDGVIDVVLELDLHFVLELARLLEELLVLNGISEVLVVLSEQVHFAVVCPGVELVAEGVLRPNTDVFASLQEQETVKFLVQVFPVEHVGHPGETVGSVEDSQRELPRHVEGVHEEQVPREGNGSVVHAVRVLEVDS